MIGKEYGLTTYLLPQSNGSVQDTDRLVDPFPSVAYYCGYHLFYVQDQVTGA